MDLETLVKQKEQELHEIHDYRLRTLEVALRDREGQLALENERFEKLRDDFQYNLKLIEDRDLELANYDDAFVEMKELLRRKDEDISQLQIKLEDYNASQRREISKLQQLESHYTQKIQNMKTSFDSAKWALDDANRRDRESFDELRADIEFKFQQASDDHERQVRELTDTFNQVSRNKHVETQNKIDLLYQTCRQAEINLQEKSKELEAVKLSMNNAGLESEQHEDEFKKLETRCKEMKWQLEDMNNLKDAKIGELTAEKIELGRSKQMILDEYEDKMTDLINSLHAVEKAFVQQKNHFENQIEQQIHIRDEEIDIKSKDLESRLCLLNQKLQVTEGHLRDANSDFQHAKWEYEEQLLAKSREIEKYKEDLVNTESSSVGQTIEIQNQLRKKDAEIMNLRNQVFAINSDLAKSVENLSNSESRANELALSELELKNQLEDLKKSFITQQEARTEQDSNKELMETNRELEQKIHQLETYSAELRSQVNTFKSELRLARDFNTKTRESVGERLDGDSLLFDDDEFGPPSPIESLASSSKRTNTKQLEFENLQHENENLRNALKDMRNGMETLTMELPPFNQTTSQVTDTSCQTDLFRNADFTGAEFSYKQNTKLNEYVELLQAQKPNPDREISILRELLKSQAEQINHVRNTLTDSISNESVQVEIKNLRNQMQELSKELEDTKKERDELGELSNRLKSQVKKSARGDATDLQLKQVEETVTQRFQDKIRSVEQALEQIVMQNRSLKQQIRDIDSSMLVRKSVEEPIEKTKEPSPSDKKSLEKKPELCHSLSSKKKDSSKQQNVVVVGTTKIRNYSKPP